jgi:RNA polymerase sigma factor (TIGR02999 family)
MSDITRILTAVQDGDAHAAAQLLPLVYEELRKLAAQKLTQEKPGQTLQATALVHEAYLRLVGTDSPQRWDSRGHFFAAAAEAMRRILVDSARRHAQLKRGGDQERVEWHETRIAAPVDQARLIQAVREGAIDYVLKTDLDRLPLALALHHRARDRDGAPRAQLHDLALIVGQRAGDHHLHGIEARPVVQVHERKARLGIPPRAHPTAHDHR